MPVNLGFCHFLREYLDETDLRFVNAAAERLLDITQI
jgi:hypothetical protein